MSDAPATPPSPAPVERVPFPAAGNISDAEREELRRHGILLTSLEELYNWGRSNSIWPLQFGLACCAIEMIAAATARFDIARFGAEIFRPSPRQADLMIVSGTVTKKMAPQVVRLWNQMPEPKYCIAMGACAISGGPFKQGYNVLKGIDRYIPVDIYIPGCPPRPEALLNGLIELQKQIKGERLTGPDAARHTRREPLSEFPVPSYGEHDLQPPQNPGVWKPAAPLPRPTKA
jgi:NADH-quinone oxidoreductase subunit B